MKQGSVLLVAALLAAATCRADEPNRHLPIIAEIIQSSATVKHATCDAATGLIHFTTADGKDRTAYYLWKPTAKHVELTAEELQQARQADFLMLGYGQGDYNPARYFWMPTKKLKQTYRLSQLAKYELPRPLYLSNFK